VRYFGYRFEGGERRGELGLVTGKILESYGEMVVGEMTLPEMKLPEMTLPEMTLPEMT
jgi:hypothetical protein